jgi:predicted methyltransferase
MRLRTASLTLAAAALAACATHGTVSTLTLDQAVASHERNEAFRARDKYRHPQETLEFFGLKPDMTVVEVWPAPGWYTEILAPYLRGRGKYIGAGFVTSWQGAPQWRVDAMKDYRAMLAAKPKLYDQVEITEVGKPDRWEAAPAGSVDLLLSFRNVHNWVAADYERDMFAAFYKALKPGGTLGVVEHRAAPGTSIEISKKSGYVTEDYVIALAEGAGFKLAGKSEINANPSDTKDYAEGVWTLPPTLKLGMQDRDKYVAIGESDRMTLKFAKPAAAP